MSHETIFLDTGKTAIVIFGVTGDLTRRKLVPALYELCLSDRLPPEFTIVGFARRPWDDETEREEMSKAVNEFARSQPVEPAVLDSLLRNANYIQSTFEDPDGYKRLKKLFDKIGLINCLFYLATPPDDYTVIIEQIGKVNLQHYVPGWTRIVIEKPYGRDLDSAIDLDEEVHRVFDESQVYRIDHYLGKETVQNILVFRFANGIFEPLWNRRYIDHIQISVSETVGVESRAEYYEKAGVIRDMFQNHLMQLLTLTAMEAPVGFNANAVRDEKVKILHSLRPLRGKDALKNTFRGQYTEGKLNGNVIPGYRQENGVSEQSVTETYLAARLFVDDWRLSGVPFYVRSGKALPERMTEVVIQFKQVPLSLFNWRNLAGDAPNMLAICIQPCEGIALTFGAKKPGPVNEIAEVKMSFDYRGTFGTEPPEAYERLLLDCLMGDATLFTRSDEVLASWAFTTEIIKAWEENPVQKLPGYPAGTWGPPGAKEFIRSDGREWLRAGPLK